MSPTLDLNLLRTSEAPEVADYLRQQLSLHDSSSISDQLLAAVETERLPPRLVPFWLSICEEPAVLNSYLQQTFSRLTRDAAIRTFCKRLTSDDVWNAVGGTDGLLKLLCTFSVQHVKQFCLFFGRRGLAQDRIEFLRPRATELFNGLVYANPDTRPLMSFYLDILPACDETCVRKWMNHNKHSLRSKRRLLEAYPAVFQGAIVQGIVHETDFDDFEFDHKRIFTRSPSTPSHQPGLSSTMAFSLQIAQTADELETSALRSQLVKDKLLLSLLRRVARRRKACDVKVVQAVATMVSRWIEHQDLSDDWAGERRIILALPHMISLWSRWTDLLQDTFIAYLQHCRLPDTEVFARSLRSVPHYQRLDLLGLLARHGLQQGVNMHDLDDLRSRELRWDPLVFFSLQHKDGLAFLDRLSRAHRGEQFLMHRAQLNNSPATIVGTDTTLLKLLLLRDRPGSIFEATTTVDEEKEQAIRSRDPKERAKHASLALTYAGSSGSLDLFASTCLWARRFNKDPLTLESLYGTKVFSAVTIELLSGLVLEAEDETMDLSMLAENVRKGNSIVLELIDNAISAIDEPSFQPQIWHKVFKVLGWVLEHRLCNAVKVQKRLELSDNDMFSSIWSSTVETCISAERSLVDTRNRPSLKKTSWYSTSETLLYSRSSNAEYDPECPTIAVFLERLAIARNDMWQQLRIESNSRVSSLEKHWPKGLPIQAVLPLDLKLGFAYENIPSLAQRAKQVVFIDRSVASLPGPRDEEEKEAVGSFVDSYKAALLIWVNTDTDPVAKKSRILQAWEHTQAELSFTFAHPDESRRFWLRFFEYECGITLPKQLRYLADSIHLTALPFHDHPRQIDAWDPRGSLYGHNNGGDHLSPDHSRRSRRSSDPLSNLRVSSPSILDGMVAYHTDSQVNLTTKYDAEKYLKPPAQEYLASQAKLAKDKESLVAASLLHFTETNRLPALLSDPFPTSDQPRFPAIILAQSSLVLLRRYDSQEVLRTFVTEVPTSLLSIIAHRLEEKGKSTSVGMTQTFSMASTILYSDRPQIVLELILRLILEHPEHSAWHRVILNRRLCLMLHPADVSRSLIQLAQDIKTIMEEAHQSGEEDSSTDDQADEDKKPYIKVTTIKLLVQLVTKAEFISAKDALDITELLCSGPTHGSVRAAVLGSIGSTLLEDADEAILESSLAAAETFVPIAARLDEARPDEAEWAAAEASGEPPPVWATDLRKLPATIKKLLQIVDSLYQAKRFAIRRAVFDRVLLPILLRSIDNNRRWTALYLARSGIETDVATVLPDIPARPTYLLALLTGCIELIPKLYLDMLDRYIFATLHLPEEIKDMNEHIRAGTRFPLDHAGRVWLHMRSEDEILNITDESFMSATSFAEDEILSTDESFGSATSFTSALSSLLQSEIEESREDGIKLADLQDFWWRYTKLFISEGSKYVACTKQQLSILEPREWMTEKQQRLWLAQCKPLLEKVISYISGLRTSEWQHDPHRKPDILPDVEELQLCALSYPDLWSELSHDERVQRFANEIISSIEACVTSDRPYHFSLKKIKRALFRFSPSKYDHEIALQLGAVNDPDNPTLVDHLRIELAGRLIHKNLQHEDDVQDPDVKERLQELAKTWLRSPIEEIRNRGIDLTERGCLRSR